MLGGLVAYWTDLAADAALSWLVYRYMIPKLEAKYLAPKLETKPDEISKKTTKLEKQLEKMLATLVEQWTQLAAHAAVAWLFYKFLVSKPEAISKREQLEKRLGRSLINATCMEDEITCNVVDPEQIDVEFDSVVGLKAVKQPLFEQVILPLQRPELFPYNKIARPRKGVLLYGQPGTVAAIFSLATKLQPAIIFLDDVDNFLGLHRCIDCDLFASMRSEFMDLWDSFTREHNNARVMILATTKNLSELDEEVRKSLPQTFEIGLPDSEERAEILKLTLKDEYSVEDKIDYNHIAGMCEGFSGSDLLEVCIKAAYFPIRDVLDEEKKGKLFPGPRPLSQLDIEKALVQYQGCKE